MTKIQVSITIHQPIECVFDYFADAQKLHLWQPELIESTPLYPASQQRSARTRNKARGWAGLTLEVEQETLELVPYKKYVNRSKEVHGLLDAQGQWDFETVPDGTRVTVQQEVDLHSWLRLTQPIFMPTARKKMKGDLLRLKNLLESN